MGEVMVFRTKEQVAQERAKMDAVFGKAVARAQEDDEKRGGLTPYLFSLTPEQRDAAAREIRADLATCGTVG
jgi:hypothetical protein